MCGAGTSDLVAEMSHLRRGFVTGLFQIASDPGRQHIRRLDPRTMSNPHQKMVNLKRFLFTIVVIQFTIASPVKAIQSKGRTNISSVLSAASTGLATQMAKAADAAPVLFLAIFIASVGFYREHRRLWRLREKVARKLDGDCGRIPR